MTRPEKSQRNAELMALHAYGTSTNEIARTFGISRSRVNQIVQRQLRRDRIAAQVEGFKDSTLGSYDILSVAGPYGRRVLDVISKC